MTNLRAQPHNLEAEKALLGAVLLSRDAIIDVIGVVNPEDLHRPAHRLILQAAISLFAREEAIDPVTIADELTGAGLLEAAGGVEAIMAIATNAPSLDRAASYAAIVADHARHRRLLAAGQEIVEMGFTPTNDVDRVVDRAEQLIFDVADRRRSADTHTLGEGLAEWVDLLEARWQAGTMGGVSTGWTDLDKLLLGLHPGQLVTVAGRPGMGKSAVAAQLAYNIADAGQPILLVSLEMGRSELTDRFMATASRVDSQRIREGSLAPNDWERITGAVTTVAPLPLHIADDPGASILSIRNLTRRLITRGGQLAAVVVDYLQLLAPAAVRDNRQVEVSEISRGLKRMALELKIPVVAMAQLNRAVETRRDKRPGLADLRESGAIENDSDVVCLLYRDDYYDERSKDKGVLEVHVAKQRSGPTGTARLAYEVATGRITSLSRSAP